MANYNNHDRNKGGYFDQYVNFDQFLMQHNMNNRSPLRGPQSGNGFMSPNSEPGNSNSSFHSPNAPNGAFYFQSQSAATSGFGPQNWVQNSNLTATATEFIPQQASSASNSTSLLATASEFIPRNLHGLDRPSKEFPSNAKKQTDTVSCDKGKNVTDDNASKTESVIQALSNTHISEEKSNEPKALNSSGGAIKKVRSQDYRNDRSDRNERIDRNDSRERHSNGNLYTGKRQERYDDYRRRNKNDNNRQNSGRATKYDSNRNYRSKNENYEEDSPTNYKKRNRYNNKGGNSQMNEKLNGSNGTNGSDIDKNHKGQPNKHPKNDIPWNRKQERNDMRDRKRYDDRPNRNARSNATKIDSANFSQREKLIREIDAGRLECLVCYDMIKPYSSVWSCPNCYHIMHLNCIIKWAESSKSEEGWRCCACQNISKTPPREYFCFCGKTKNPQYNRTDMAHSCGDVCSRIDRDNCPHPCTQLCHPGPCPQCQVMVTRECCCGKTSKMYQCNQKVEFKCDQQCGKDLNCKVHTCEKSCHSGNCDDCTEVVEQTCYCSRENRTVPCTRENKESLTYSCGSVCNKQLKCGNHKCKELCHDGDCGECELLPQNVKTCPCGKTQIEKDQRTSCIDPIPLCTSTCKKRLTCGQPSNPHTCVSKCHYGVCPPCNKQTAVKCRCGHMDQMIKCNQLSTRADDARCKRKCTKKRNCGKHKCNQECCIDIDHECPMKCTYTLSCGKHKCESTCHKGRCLPCYRSSFDELYCECGANVIYPPVPCGTKRPACDRPCSRQHPCDHEITHNCHSAQNCPPCMAFTKKYCHGRHEQRNIIPCSQKDFSCGLPCNKPLKCGRHKCIKICHPGACETETDICKQNCPKPRVMCPHACNAPCHLDTRCPDTSCRETIEVSCQCGLRKQNRTCHEFSSEYRKIATAQLASSMDQMQNGGTVELSDVLGPIKTTNNKTLECNEECRMAERNRRLAIGLQIRNPDLPSKLQPKYSEFIRGWGKKDPKLVSMIHEKLTDLVKLAKESKQKSRSYSFPTMNREKRQLVHEMCAMFGVESKAYDAEPNRNVVASATRVTSWLPSMSIMEVLERENGQRRVPVPNNMNAWGIRR